VNLGHELTGHVQLVHEDRAVSGKAAPDDEIRRSAAAMAVPVTILGLHRGSTGLRSPLLSGRSFRRCSRELSLSRGRSRAGARHLALLGDDGRLALDRSGGLCFLGCSFVSLHVFPFFILSSTLFVLVLFIVLVLLALLTVPFLFLFLVRGSIVPLVRRRFVIRIHDPLSVVRLVRAGVRFTIIGVVIGLQAQEHHVVHLAARQDLGHAPEHGLRSDRIPFRHDL
jgi:hypothetical protein